VPHVLLRRDAGRVPQAGLPKLRRQARGMYTHSARRDTSRLTTATLQMRGDQDQVMNCTTAQFDGVIAMIRPEESWVVRDCFVSILHLFDRARSPP
jgi:hypothetical protein